MSAKPICRPPARNKLITAEDEENPPKQPMAQLLCEWAKAVSQRRVPAPAAPLPWDDIITWWDGQERMQFR